jgi:hypothetical protein
MATWPLRKIVTSAFTHSKGAKAASNQSGDTPDKFPPPLERSFI